MALTKLRKLFGTLFGHEKTPQALVLTSTSLTLTASYQDVLWSGNAGLDADSSPCAAFTGTWTPNATAVSMTIKALVSLDGGVTYGPPPNIPASTSGALTGYPAELTLNKADYGNVTTAMQIAFILEAVKGYRTFKIQAKSDTATGSPTLVLKGAVGTT